jgi:hypothetical protein
MLFDAPISQFTVLGQFTPASWSQSGLLPAYIDGPIVSVHAKEYSEPLQYWHATLNKLGLETN